MPSFRIMCPGHLLSPSTDRENVNVPLVQKPYVLIHTWYVELKIYTFDNAKKLGWFEFWELSVDVN